MSKRQGVITNDDCAILIGAMLRASVRTGDLAQRLRIHRSTLWLYETGQRMPPPGFWKRYEKELRR